MLGPLAQGSDQKVPQDPSLGHKDLQDVVLRHGEPQVAGISGMGDPGAWVLNTENAGTGVSDMNGFRAGISDTGTPGAEISSKETLET